MFSSIRSSEQNVSRKSDSEIIAVKDISYCVHAFVSLFRDQRARSNLAFLDEDKYHRHVRVRLYDGCSLPHANILANPVEGA